MRIPESVDQGLQRARRMERPARHGRRSAAVAAGLGVAALLSACGANGEKTTQVAAKVNGEEISVHQINFILQRTPGVTPGTADAASRQIVERLVTQELAIQKAQELKLDRSPSTVQALEAARRDVLARAYVESLAEGVPRPTAEDVADYYAKKPALFRNRKVFTFQEISIGGTAAQMAEAQAKLNQVKSAQEFTDYLKASGLKHGAKLVNQPAENIPLELLDGISTMNAGQIMFLPAPGGARALHVVSVRSEPVDQTTAAPAIEKYLLNERKRTKTEADMKALRAGASVQLMGKFAAPAASAPSLDAATAAAASDVSPAASAGPAASGPSADVVRKGLSHLK